MTTFKFFRHKDGVSAFAEISLEAVCADDGGGNIRWASELSTTQAVYSDAVSAGVKRALCWHIGEGGSASNFEVKSFVEMLVDTKPDAVECAATGAAWRALGHDDSDLAFEFSGIWKAIRK